MLMGRSLGGRRPMSKPWTLMLPSVGNSRPAIMRSVVVLPHPDGPSSEKNSPSAMERWSSSTATTSPNRLMTPSSSTAGSANLTSLLRVWGG